MAYERDARTAFASKALELSDMFMIKFGRRAFGGAVPRGVHVAPPEESTGGGVRAREAISLVPAGGAPGSTLVIGWMNVAENRAELRTYDVLDEIHRQRFGSPLDLVRGEYEGFLDEARRFFSEEAIALELLTEAPAPPPVRAAAAANGAPRTTPRSTPQVSPRVGPSAGGSAPSASPVLPPAVDDSLSFGLGAVSAMVIAAFTLGIGLGWLLFAP